jgi:hypothetical protein
VRSIARIRTNIKTTDLSGAVGHHFARDWSCPTNKAFNEKLQQLLSRVHPDISQCIKHLTHVVLVHRHIDGCDALVSYSADDDVIQVRIFHDHIETLRDVTGKFLKRFYKSFAAKEKKVIFELDGDDEGNRYIEIAEVQKNNVLDSGVLGLRHLDYIRKTLRDRLSEFWFGLLATIVSLAGIAYLYCNFHVDPKTFEYECISKLIGPFMAAALLTFTHLFLHYWALRAKTNVIWGARKERE